MYRGFFTSFKTITPHSILLFFCIFSGNINMAIASQVVKVNIPTKFEAKSIEGASYEWEFPNGIKKSGKNIMFSFKKPGNVEVTLKVKKGGVVETITKKITVQNPEKPTAIVKITVDGKSYGGGTIPFHKNQSINFASESISADGTNMNLSETWWVDGKIEELATLPHLLKESRLYPMKLIVTEKGVQNVRDEVSFQVDVVNMSPEIKDISVNSDLNQRKQVSVQVEADDLDGRIEQYRFEVLEFNRVVLAQVTTKGTAVFNLNQFPGKHQYRLRVTVKDDGGSETSKDYPQSIDIDSTISNTPPDVKIKALPGNTGTTATEFVFTAEASDPDGDALRYLWTMPDGSKKTSKSFHYQFSKVGTKQITLSVTDGIDTTEKSLSVQVLKEIKNHPPVVEIKGVSPAVAGDTETIFKFYANISDPDNDEVQHLWELEPGKKSNVLNVAHKFKKPGTYVVKLSGTDGKIKVSDEIVVQVVDVGKKIPEIKTDKVISESPDSDNEEFSVEIASNKDTNSCNPFSQNLLKILRAERDARKKILESGKLSPKNRGKIKAAIALIDDKINLIKFDPFSLRTEFKKGKILELKKARSEKITAFKAFHRNKKEKSRIQDEILELSKAIRRQELGRSNEILVEDILIAAQKSREKKLETQPDKVNTTRLKAEIKAIKKELYTLNNSPFFSRTESAKICLLRLKEELKDPQKVQIVSAQIRTIEETPETEDSTLVFADIVANTHTKLFLYGRVPTDINRALYFEWELGKNLHIPGQNISLRYRKPGLYKVTLKIDDGRKVLTDTITIKIVGI